MQALIDAVTSFMTAMLTWFSEIAEAVVSQPVLLIFIIVLPVTSFVWSLVMSIVHRRKGKRG